MWYGLFYGSVRRDAAAPDLHPAAADRAEDLFQYQLTRVFGTDDLAVLAAVLVALHLSLVRPIRLLQDGIGLLDVGLDAREVSDTSG